MAETVHIQNTFAGKYQDYLEDLKHRGSCPFCEINLELNKPIRTGLRWWHAWHCPKDFIKPGHGVHIVLPSIPHWTSLGEITPEAASELWVTIASLVEEFNLEGGGIVVRFGRPDLSGSTIPHLHANIIEPVKGAAHTEQECFAVLKHSPALDEFIQERRSALTG